MRFATQKYFESDWARLKPEHRRHFKAVVREKFIPACDAWAQAQESGKPYTWPKSLRVAPVVNGGGILEMTWSFASPDGRATFHFARDEGHWVCHWRRIGDHGVFRSP
ncbi:MAG: hypothetical protein NWS04_02555 [Candidatus Nanopelagicales bacterium]|mgnify:FL=1|nr:hypothetical protein [Candidatus Nanopelagicales bacterium]